MAGETGVLILGSTGYIGKHVALAAAAEPGVKAYALISKATQAKPERAEVLQRLRSAGVQFLEVSCTSRPWILWMAARSWNGVPSTW